MDNKYIKIVYGLASDGSGPLGLHLTKDGNIRVGWTAFSIKNYNTITNTVTNTGGL
jgi:L-2-hydroxyglutarate oxidase LhgO